MTKSIPPLVDEVYEFLKTEVQWLFARKILFDQLYRKSDLRLDLLNEAAPSFFHTLQLLIYDDLQLGIARLTDPAPNKASLHQLQKRLTGQADHLLAKKTNAVLSEIDDVVEPIRANRDNMLAHYSIDQATKDAQLPDVYYKDIETATALIAQYMNLIEEHYTGFTQGYEHFAWQDDGDTLTQTLKWAIRYRNEFFAQEIAIEPHDRWSDA